MEVAVSELRAHLSDYLERARGGDEVVITNQNYGRMITTWEQRARRDGIVVRQISFPVPPPSREDVVDRFRRAITPRTRVLEVTHITNLTGQILPVREIVRMAREKNVEVFVDGAHAFAHFPSKRDDLECDYYGTSLHKWLLAPIGTGFLYVRKEKQKKIWPLMAAPPAMDNDIRKYEEIGTHPAANHNAIAEALAFHQAVEQARLAYVGSSADAYLSTFTKEPAPFVSICNDVDFLSYGIDPCN